MKWDDERHDDRPRIGDQALLSLLVLGPPVRSLTVWATVVAEREAAWLFSRPFRATRLSDELLGALYGLATDLEAPQPVRLKIRGIFYALARSRNATEAAQRYAKRLESIPEEQLTERGG